jgi:hypothetical protein
MKILRFLWLCLLLSPAWYIGGSRLWHQRTPDGWVDWVTGERR